MQSDNYWSGTEITAGNNAWNFNPDNGNQNDDNQNNNQTYSGNPAFASPA